MLLYLDDIRVPSMCLKYLSNKIYRNNEDWVIVRNYDEFVKAIVDYYQETNMLPDLISFDFDLGTTDIVETPNGLILTAKENVYAKTGIDCCKFLTDFCMDNEINQKINFLIHSQNPVGAEQMMSFLTQYNKFIENNKQKD